MRMPTVKNFLCCFELEVCGYLVGWLGSIIPTLAIIFVASAGVLMLTSFEEFGNKVRNQEIQINFVIDYVIEMALSSKAGESNN